MSRRPPYGFMFGSQCRHFCSEVMDLLWHHPIELDVGLPDASSYVDAMHLRPVWRSCLVRQIPVLRSTIVNRTIARGLPAESEK